MSPDLWQRGCERLAADLPEQQYATWIRPLPPADEPVVPAQAPAASARAPLVVIDLPLPHWLTEGARWLALRVMAGTVLFFATPIGYGRALWKHLEGRAMADVIADCRRNAQQ